MFPEEGMRNAGLSRLWLFFKLLSMSRFGIPSTAMVRAVRKVRKTMDVTMDVP